jgi:hypothetical protein
MIDTDKYEETDHPELVEFEGDTLGDTLTNLLAEVKRLREQNEYFRGLLDHYKGRLIDEDAEVKRLREGIKRIADLAVKRNARHTEKGLLELIE